MTVPMAQAQMTQPQQIPPAQMSAALQKSLVSVSNQPPTHTPDADPSVLRAREAEYNELIDSLVSKIELLEKEKEQLRVLRKEDFVIH